MRGVLWRELRRLHAIAQHTIALGGRCHKQPATGLLWEDGREVIGFATNEPERMAGLSAEHLLFVVDEASGVDESIFEAIEGNRAAGARIVMLSNPTRTSGTFFEAFHRKQSFWRRLHVSSEEAARLEPPIRGLATQSWIDEKIDEWGRESPAFRVRCAGEFAAQADRSVLSLASVEAARRRSVERAGASQHAPLEVGVDVARFGADRSIVALRRGALARPLVALAAGDGPDTAGNVLQIIARERVGAEPVRVKIDVIGVGASVFDALVRTAPEGVEVIAVNVAERATDEEHFARLRDQLWFALRAWIDEGGAIPDDPLLEAELLAPEYRFDARGRYVVESKDDTKARLRRSPDRADALALCVYSPPSVAYQFTRIRSSR